MLSFVIQWEPTAQWTDVMLEEWFCLLFIFNHIDVMVCVVSQDSANIVILQWVTERWEHGKNSDTETCREFYRITHFYHVIQLREARIATVTDTTMTPPFIRWGHCSRLHRKMEFLILDALSDATQPGICTTSATDYCKNERIFFLYYKILVLDLNFFFSLFSGQTWQL